MNNTTYVQSCQKENKMFLMHESGAFESMTIQEYNERFNSNFSDWQEIDNDDLFSAEQVLEFEDLEQIRFL